MTHIIQFHPSDRRRYFISIELSTGQKVTDDIFPLLIFFEKFSKHPEKTGKTSIAVMKAIFEILAEDHPEIESEAFSSVHRMLSSLRLAG